MQSITYELAIDSLDGKKNVRNEKGAVSGKNQNGKKANNINRQSNNETDVELEGPETNQVGNNTNSNSVKSDNTNLNSKLNESNDSGNTSTNATNAAKEANQQKITDTVTRVTAMAAALNSIQSNVGSLIVGSEEEIQFYNRKVKPLLDELYFLSFASQSMSIAAQNLQSNAYAKKRQMRLPVDLTYEIIKEAYCVLDTLKKRNAIYRSIVEEEVEKCGGLPSDYKSCFDCLNEDDENSNEDDEK